MRISSDGYRSKVRKVSRWKPTVSNGTSQTTTQEIFLQK